MKKRLHDCDIWEESWFADLSRDHRIFWIYLKDTCDVAGIWRPNNIGIFKRTHRIRIDLNEALAELNKDKERIKVLKNGRWFLTGFLHFHYGSYLNPNSPLHASALKSIEDNAVELGYAYPSVTAKIKNNINIKNKDLKKEVLGENKTGTWQPGIGGRRGR